MDGRELKQYERWKQEAQLFRAENQHLRLELNACRPELYRADQKIDRLEHRLNEVLAENKMLKRKLADLAGAEQPKRKASPPPFVKANIPSRPARRPGRKKGHPAALRPMPAIIDVQETVTLPVDALGKTCCPDCRSQLNEIETHERYVEELIPSKVVTTCYHTTSGWCPCCRKRIESRAENQPPAADLPHAQLGLNALSTAMVMRVCYRLPFRQITRLFLQLPGLKISPGAIVKQIKRCGKWLQKQYHRLKWAIRAAGVVHADETGWRTSGKNGYLWTLSTADMTLFHVDPSRGAKVIAELLGEAFGKEGQTLVSDFYSVYDQFDGPQQKCLTHLLRELRETIAQRPELSSHVLFVRCKRLVQDMLRLKKRRGKLKAAQYWRRVQRLEQRLKELAAQRFNDPDTDRLAKRLNKYQSKLTTFLHKQEVDGTNNAAERALRPAVVMRKVAGCSRSAAGAKAWAIVASVMRTAEQQGKDVLESIKTLLKAEWSGKETALLTELLPLDSS